MPRINSNIITDENYFEYLIPIGRDVVDYVIAGLREKYTAVYRPVPEYNPLAYNILSISMYFDTDYSTLYITYKLDENRKVAVKASDKELYNRIYDKMHMIDKEQDITMHIVGEPSIADNYLRKRENPKLDIDKNCLRLGTRSVWDVRDKEYGRITSYLVENKALYEDQLRKLKIKINQEDISDIEKQNQYNEIQSNFCKNVIKLNKRYIWVPKPDEHKAFKEFSTIYKNYYNNELKEVEEWKGFTIYIDVTHDYDEERLDPQIHNIGRFLEKERVEKYIAKWGHDHDRWVPDEYLRKYNII